MVAETEGFDTKACPYCSGSGESPDCGCSEDECCHCEGSGVLILAPYGTFADVLSEEEVDKFAAYWCAGNREHNLGEFIQMIAFYTVVQMAEE